MKLTDSMKETAEEMANRYYFLDWPEYLAAIIEEALELTEPDDFEVSDFLHALKIDIEHRTKFGCWPDYE